ncbi:hypothetical protein DEO72_LG9g1421 [Vigna unguiculata]|uniref:Uncharacterized protein n=1 Tax=Vigna unguiculata TaxID=3917 RepID=A0A4D6N1S4_VIGUN|nr:hypothetical protein DEO72_LG9g1421 [Vigna unguiculata]
MPFRAQLEGCTCLTPIPSSTQGIRSEINSRNPSILPLKHHQKPCRTLYKVQQLGLTTSKSSSGGHVPLGAAASRPPGGGHVPLGAKRLKHANTIATAWRDNPPPPNAHAPEPYRGYRYRLAIYISSPGASRHVDSLFRRYRLAGVAMPPGAVPEPSQILFSLISHNPTQLLRLNSCISTPPRVHFFQ